MNERLEQLAVEAKELAEQAFREDNAKRFTVMEKFAELIVKECMYIGRMAQINGQLVDSEIKDHFEDEE